jgi:uncharacterized RDD family membrane protein YckC
MVTPELIKYIKQARTAGQTDAQIKEALLKIGWKEADINNEFNPPETLVVNYRENSSSETQDQGTNVVYAGFWIRVAASFIDGIIVFIPAFFLGLVSAVAGLNESVAKFFVVIIVFGLFIYMIMKYQATPGKMALGLIIVSDNLERVTLGQVMLREIVGKFLSSILYIGYIMVAFTQKKQGLHDMIAKTLVIYKNG